VGPAKKPPNGNQGKRGEENDRITEKKIASPGGGNGKPIAEKKEFPRKRQQTPNQPFCPDVKKRKKRKLFIPCSEKQGREKSPIAGTGGKGVDERSTIAFKGKEPAPEKKKKKKGKIL